MIREPIERGGRVIAVIEARGGIVSRREPAQRQALFELLAAEAGAALERDELLRGVAERAETDGLTGLANRRAWDRMLGGALERARGVGAPLSVALLGLDHFKHFNDVHGPSGGRPPPARRRRRVAAAARAGRDGRALGRRGVRRPAAGPLAGTATSRRASSWSARTRRCTGRSEPAGTGSPSPASQRAAVLR